MTKPRVIFFGNERLATGISSSNTPLLKGLLERDYNVVAIASHGLTARSRRQQQLEVAEIANKHNILFLSDGPKAIKSTLESLQPDIAILAAYGHIISQSVIDLFPGGIINIHPSLLPRYRGSSPIESAILNGDSTTGVSIMQLTAGMDEGPVYAQKTIEVHENESKQSLHDRLATAGADLLFDHLPQIVDGSLRPTPQNSTRASYTKRLLKSDGAIDWQQPAELIERQIRAFLGWPGSRTTLGKVEAVITDVTTSNETFGGPGDLSFDSKNTTLKVATADGSLIINSLKPIGKKEMPIRAFLAGYQSRLSN